MSLVSIRVFTLTVACALSLSCGSGGSSGPVDCYPDFEAGLQPPFEELDSYASQWGTWSVAGAGRATQDPPNAYSWTEAANTRDTFYILPKGDPTRQTDNPMNFTNGTWPVLIHFPADTPYGSDQDQNQCGLDADPAACRTFSINTNCANASSEEFLRAHCNSTKYRNILFAGLLKEGFAIVLPNPFTADTWYSNEATPSAASQCINNMAGVQCANTNDPFTTGYWPGPDETFLTALFQQIANSGLELETSEVSMTGYSVGGQLISRLINELPPASTWDLPNQSSAPRVRSAMLLSAGSYYCYSDDSSEIPGGGGDGNWCPPVSVDVTEFNYWQPPDPQSVTPTPPTSPTPWSQHPPVLVAQTTNDNNAPQAASQNYHEVLDQNTQGLTPGRASIVQADLDSNEYDQCFNGDAKSFQLTHVFFPEMVMPTIQFIRDAGVVAP